MGWRNKNLYCWGNNANNVMGLDRKSKYKDDIIWKPELHNLFNDSKDGKRIINIKCQARFVCFIDHKYQCYWSPSSKDDSNLTHFQAMDEKYEMMKIQHVLLDQEIDTDDNVELTFVDTDNQIIYFDSSEDGDKRLTVRKIDEALDPGDKVMEIDWNGKNKVMFVKKKINLE